jgi:RNA polymerase sigma-70 factor (ECF subfamily)
VTLSLEEHVDAVYRYALRLTRRADLAEDVAQETLLRAWKSRDRLRDCRAARSWLLRITTNVWNDQLRKNWADPAVLESEPPCSRRPAAQVFSEREDVRLALAAMDQLPDRQRQVLYLITCEQLSHEEVAEVLEIGVAAVKSNLCVARKAMRTRLKTVYESVCTPAAEGKPT